jgi:hypothetical protein
VTHKEKNKPKMGRPRVLEIESRSIFISTRLSPGEHQKISDAIKKSGKTKSNWLREALLEKAR